MVAMKVATSMSGGISSRQEIAGPEHDRIRPNTSPLIDASPARWRAEEHEREPPKATSAADKRSWAGRYRQLPRERHDTNWRQ